MAVSIYILLSTIKLFTIFRKSSVCSPAGKPVVSSGSGRFCSAAIVHFVAVVVLHAAYIYIYIYDVSKLQLQQHRHLFTCTCASYTWVIM